MRVPEKSKLFFSISKEFKKKHDISIFFRRPFRRISEVSSNFGSFVISHFYEIFRNEFVSKRNFRPNIWWHFMSSHGHKSKL